MLFDFSGLVAAQAGVNVHDGVLGGVADGRFKISNEKTMVFFGTSSLENNGEFWR